MNQIKYFYNYNAVRKGIYNKFNHGVLTINMAKGDDVPDVYQYLVDEANKLYPDNDTINITALNII